MSTCRGRQGFLSFAVVVMLLMMVMTCMGGCNPLQLIGPNSSINIVLPLGLSGGSGLLNPPSGVNIFGIPLSDTTSSNIPPISSLDSVGTGTNTATGT